MKRKLKVAVVGASGAVGLTLLSILGERSFPVEELRPFASPRSKGKSVKFEGHDLPLQTLHKGCFHSIDLAFFDASDEVSREWVPEAVQAGAWVVDNSGAFRRAHDIPLLVPEVNGVEFLNKISKKKSTIKPTEWNARERILSGPNCVAVPLALVLKPIHDLFTLTRVVVSTYQSTSGAGARAQLDLLEQTRAYLGGERRGARSSSFPHPIAFNCIPHVGRIDSEGHSSEEEKVTEETRKILGIPELRLSVTAVRVPTLHCHAESLNVECERAIDLHALRGVLKQYPGLRLQDEPDQELYPLARFRGEDPKLSATGGNLVHVGRLRRDTSVPHGLNLWLVSDNLRKGAALNAVQMGEILLDLLWLS